MTTQIYPFARDFFSGKLFSEITAKAPTSFQRLDQKICIGQVASIALAALALTAGFFLGVYSSFTWAAVSVVVGIGAAVIFRDMSVIRENLLNHAHSWIEKHHEDYPNWINTIFEKANYAHFNPPNCSEKVKAFLEFGLYYLDKILGNDTAKYKNHQTKFMAYLLNRFFDKEIPGSEADRKNQTEVFQFLANSLVDSSDKAVKYRQASIYYTFFSWLKDYKETFPFTVVFANFTAKDASAISKNTWLMGCFFRA